MRLSCRLAKGEDASAANKVQITRLMRRRNGPTFESIRHMNSYLAFGLGVATGVLIKGGARDVLDRVRLSQAHREYEDTVEYDENLPDSLGRREPAPSAGQPRFGGTGALGVSPAAVKP
jgi:hypothetical protein